MRIARLIRKTLKGLLDLTFCSKGIDVLHFNQEYDFWLPVLHKLYNIKLFVFFFLDDVH